MLTFPENEISSAIFTIIINFHGGGGDSQLRLYLEHDQSFVQRLAS
jgi:hypothetical protein